jgi:hypothetical protein
MKNIHHFTDLNTGLKIPFSLDRFTLARPIAKDEAAGTLLYGVGISGGISVKETLPQVNEVVGAWQMGQDTQAVR